MAQLCKEFGEEWDAVYGPNRDPIRVEQYCRRPGDPLETWQRMRDYRQALKVKRSRFRERQRQKTLKKIKAGNRDRKSKERHRSDPRTPEQKQADKDAKKLLNAEARFIKRGEDQRKRRAQKKTKNPSTAAQKE